MHIHMLIIIYIYIYIYIARGVKFKVVLLYCLNFNFVFELIVGKLVAKSSHKG